MEFQWKVMKGYLKGIELLQTRGKRVVVLIVRKALHFLFGTDAKIISGSRRKWKGIKMSLQSVSILNMKRLELEKDRASINWLSKMRELRPRCS